jgi:hypothetical protein
MRGLKLMTAAVVASGLLVTPLMAQEATPKAMAEQFLTQLSQGEVDQAYDQLFKGSPTAQSKAQEIDAVKRQTGAVLPTYGKILGHDFACERKIGASIVIANYVLREEKHPLIWTFFFYKPNDSWVTDSVTFNDKYLMPACSGSS